MSEVETAPNQTVPQDARVSPTSRTTLALVLLAAALFAAWWMRQERAQPALSLDASPIPVATVAPDLMEEAAARPAPVPQPKATASKRPVARDRFPALIASSRVVPTYPASALRRGEAGVVTVAATIDPSGTPVKVGIDDRSGNRDLDRAAVAAVKQWRFQPALRNGKAVEGLVRIPVEFTLERS